MRPRLLFVLFYFFFIFQIFADEGMWPLIFLNRLNQAELKKNGLHLTPQEIYSINHSSLKDAVVALNGGSCTGEIVSGEGLILTNHHCGFDAIQNHSTVNHDYIKDGFWAKNYSEELPNPDMYIQFFIRMEDVTKRILPKLTSDLTEEERDAVIGNLSEEIITEATQGNHYEAQVKSFFEGKEFYLFVYENYNDVRLVGAPPATIGKFGGDTDNWIWPRHTGDFSLFRVYTGKDGKPTSYSSDNKPLKTKRFLPISLKGVKKNDFTMVLGYPGTTNRYLTSYGVKQTIDIVDPLRVKIRGKRLAIYKADMDSDQGVKIKYAAKYAQVSNYWKYFIGEREGLLKLNIYQKKKNGEKVFMDWVNSNSERKQKYGEVLLNIEQAYVELEEVIKFNTYINEAIFAPDIVTLAFKFAPFVQLLNSPPIDSMKLNATVASMKEVVATHFKDYNLPTDKKLMAAMLKYFSEDIPESQQPSVFDSINVHYNGNFEQFVNHLYLNSLFSTEDKINFFLNNPSLESLSTDPAFDLMKQFVGFYFQNISQKLDDAHSSLDANQRMYLQGLREMKKDRLFYPDANSTLRINFGKVLGYYPRDGVFYEYFTTLKGVMEKEDTTNEDFIVPPQLKELYKKKDFGRFGANNEMRVAFITNNDITGGNSGSPVMNGRGELVGIAFDGNWEAMSGNIAYEPSLQRCIAVDIRYVLFIIEKFAGANNLIEEMTLLKK